MNRTMKSAIAATSTLASLAVLAAPAAGAPQPAGAQPGDDAMTCEQIAAELMPYMHQVQPTAQEIVATQQRQFEHGLEKGKQRQAEHQVIAGMATAAQFDPTGASKRAYAAAEMAQMAKERREDAAEAASPQAQQAKAQYQQMAAQAQALQGDGRLQRLMQLGQQKGCDRKR
ncbi:MAG TPA: hypothetical protein VMU47_20710 [Caldimonas sp.]|nr:hypothetical protein [Caldimonas sp.]